MKKLRNPPLPSARRLTARIRVYCSNARNAVSWRKRLIKAGFGASLHPAPNGRGLIIEIQGSKFTLGSEPLRVTLHPGSRRK